MASTTADLLKAGRKAAANQQVAQDHAKAVAASLTANAGHGLAPSAGTNSQVVSQAGRQP